VKGSQEKFTKTRRTLNLFIYDSDCRRTDLGGVDDAAKYCDKVERVPRILEVRLKGKQVSAIFLFEKLSFVRKIVLCSKN
jgi:hypothetical protein